VIAPCPAFKLSHPPGCDSCEQAVNDPSDPQTVIVNLGRALGSGTYKVSWHMISINQRPTSGTFLFTVS